MDVPGANTPSWSGSSSTGLPAELGRGIACCQKGRWKEGLDLLSEGVMKIGNKSAVPPEALSYLGYAMARCDGKVQEGLGLCKRAVKGQFFDPVGIEYLARTQLLAGNRRQAVSLLDRGLEVDPDHSGLLQLADEMGQRRPPVVGFLGRRNPINRLLGVIRHKSSRSK